MHVYTISKINLEREALNYNWTDHAINIIKEIVKVWLDSNIAKAILLFFKEDISGDLHSYMPIGLKINENTPKLKSFRGPKGQAKISGHVRNNSSDVISKSISPTPEPR